MSDRTKQGSGDGVDNAANNAADNAAVRAYRAANALTDERPSAATRAAVLQFAQAHAPQKISPNARGTTRGTAWGTRWPYAAAATLLVGALAGLLATQTEQHLPKETVVLSRGVPQSTPHSAEPARRAEDSTAQVASAPPAAPVAAGMSAAAKPQQSQAPAVSTAPSVTLRAARQSGSASSESMPSEAASIKTASSNDKAVELKEETPVPQIAQRARENEEARGAGRLQERADAPVARAENARRFSAPVPAAPAATADAATTEQSATEQAAAEPAATTKKAAQAMQLSKAVGSASSRNADDHVIARPVQRTRPMADGEGVRQEAELTAEAWIARIVKLREQGRHAEADAELKKFRERYPGVNLPASALRPQE